MKIHTSIYPLIFLSFCTSCTLPTQKSRANNDDFILITKTNDFTINGKSWYEIEMSENPDTALTLFAYRMLFTNELESINDCVSRKNLIESHKTVKKLMPIIFDGHVNKLRVNYLIDSLNLEAFNYAKVQVENDLKKYGKSDGSCYDLYKKNKLRYKK